MGMASSDDEEKIMEEYALMEKIKAVTPEYGYVTHGMSEDAKAIYDHTIKNNFINRDRFAEQLAHSIIEVKARNHPRSNQAYRERVSDNDVLPPTSQEKAIDAEIRILKKKIEIARLKKELAELEGK